MNNVLSTKETNQILDSMVESVTRSHQRVQPEKFENLYFPNVSILEQKIISQYLDKKTSQIDSLIEKIKKKIELLNEQKTVLINRGWVPKKYLNKNSRKFTLLEGKVNLIGIIKFPQEKGMFVPDNEPENGF